MTGTAQRRRKARETYEGALDRGKTATLHEEAVRGVHVLSVSHVPPGAAVSVTGVWAMPLANAGGGGFLRIPTTVGDVFGRSPLPDSDDLVHGPVVQMADVEVSCDAGAARIAGVDLVDGKARVALDAPIDVLVAGAPPRALHGVSAGGRVVTLSVAPDAGGRGVIDAACSRTPPAPWTTKPPAAVAGAGETPRKPNTTSSCADSLPPRRL